MTIDIISIYVKMSDGSTYLCGNAMEIVTAASYMNVQIKLLDTPIKNVEVVKATELIK